MANYSTNLKSWGASGSTWPDGYKYVEGEQPVDDWDNFFASNVISDVKDHLIPLTNSRIESDKGGSGGEPESPEESHLYHDQTNDRLRVWDGAASQWHDLMHRDGDTMTGVLDMGGYKVHDSTGTLTLGGTVNVSGTLQYGGNEVATKTWATGSNIAVGDLSGVSSEGSGGGLNADQLDGNHASAFASSGHTHSLGDLSDVSASGEGSGNNFNADMVDGKHASDLGKSASQVQGDTLMFSGYAPYC